VQAVDHLFELFHPELRDPVLLAAFAGWNDAAEVASGTLRYLLRQWHAEPCAEIDPEEFFVFTETRPQVKIVDSVQRRITWPQNQFYVARPPNSPREFLILVGAEPQLRWKTFTRLILDYAASCDVKIVLSLGGLLADVLHSRSPVLTGSIAEPTLARRVTRLGLKGTRYEGPTGIVGVLGAACRERGILAGSIWGNVPHYISSMSNPDVSIALARCVGDLFDLVIDLSELERASVRFNAQVNRAIADDADAANYIRQLEARETTSTTPLETTEESSGGATELPSADALVQDLEEFLRRRGQQSGD
jgi:proteasome assembly chaperone (PAC2) family protein